jgi:hypothetical protein
MADKTALFREPIRAINTSLEHLSRFFVYYIKSPLMEFRKIMSIVALVLFIGVISSCAQPKSCVQSVKGAEQVNTD